MLDLPRTGNGGPTLTILGCAGLTLATAWLLPPLLPPLIGAFLALGIVLLAYRHPTFAWQVWLLTAGLSMEMALSDVVGPEAFQPTIAIVKGAEIGLVGLMILRFGLVIDPYNPAWAFAAMAVMGAVVGIHPDLSVADMLRSLAGSVVPFLVFFCRRPAGWSGAIRCAVMFVPLLSVVLGTMLDVAGLRHVFLESGGLRLAGLGHPAFLAGVCLPAIYACLLWWLRTGSRQGALLLGVNLIILFLTGARAPAAYAAIVVGGSLIFAPDAAMPRAHRIILVAAGAAAAPALLILGEAYGSFRLFEVIAEDAGHLSGRDLLWPVFEAAAAKAPWFGWGVGSGNFVIPHVSQLVQLLGTWAAHNEYLRIQVEGGYFGRTLLVMLFVLWTVSHTRRLPRLERLVMRLIFLSYAAHAFTDNVLISTPACVFFAFVAAMFAGTGDSASNRLRQASDVA